jgi:hypothetical protein
VNVAEDIHEKHRAPDTASCHNCGRLLIESMARCQHCGAARPTSHPHGNTGNAGRLAKVALITVAILAALGVMLDIIRMIAR